MSRQFAQIWPAHHIVQPNSWSCTGCAAAMATGRGLDDFIAIAGHDGSDLVEGSAHPDGHRGFSMADAAMWFLTFGHLLGAVFRVSNGGLSSALDMQMVLSLKGVKALLMVDGLKSKDVRCGHCVYWDGHGVWDSGIDTKGKEYQFQPIENYQIRTIYVLSPLGG